MRKFIFLILVLFSLTNCKKEKEGGNMDTDPVYPPAPVYIETPGFPDCSLDLEDATLDFEDGTPTSGPNYYLVTRADTGIEGFRVSPLDENRLLLLVRYRIDRYEYTDRMAVYNIVTNTFEPVGDFVVNDIAVPDWNNKERILYTSSGGLIFSVNPDGSDMQQLTSSYRNFYPLWNPQGDHFFFHQYNPATQGRFNLVANGIGQILDTIFTQRTRFTDWVQEDIILLGGVFIYLDLKSDLDYGFENLDDAASSMTMSIPGEILYLTNTSEKPRYLSAYNLGTREFRNVKYSCISNAFECIDYAPKNKKLIISLNRLVQTGPQNLKEVHDLYIMDVDGGNPKLIKTFH
ncbi:MAG TPA: hypothetical protein DIW47_04160 [Bacteroidetes bacterium]|nr:hypothetical protein [Bacteroidota bacterium]